MNDHRNSRHRLSEPAWPSGDDPDAARWPKHEEPQERTGFWSPLWEDDDDDPAPGRRPQARGRAPQPPTQAARTGQPRRATPPAQPTQAMRPAGRPGPPPPGTTVVLPGARRPQPRDNSQDPTEALPQVAGGSRREPDLLTHREPEYGEDEYGEDAPLSEDQRRLRRKKIWRRIRRTMYVFIALMIIGPILAFLITYQLVSVPSPNEIAANQSRLVTLQYADGSKMTDIVPENGNRTMVSYNDIPKQVLNAVFAAEDNTFMSNAGFDLSGVLRAGWNQLTGGTGGGSTITQQYIKKATGNDDPTPTRKAVEVVKAYKMNRTYSKEQIIEAYLNTIYFGRNAYGIVAAAKAYYGKELKALSGSEAALLAGMIQSPSRFKDDAYMQKRWNYVMDQLVANNWFPAAQRKTEKFPKPVPYEQTKNQALTGPRGLIEDVVFDELERDMGLSREAIQRGGYTIKTTIDPKAQQIAEDAVNSVMKDQPEQLRPALVAVDPKNGEIKAYYGGKSGTGLDWAGEPQEPGSSFKPFDLLAMLELPNAEEGKGLDEIYDGSSPRSFAGRAAPVRNAGKSSCGSQCTVATAMKESLNTVFYDMALNTTGTKKVAAAAKQAGILSDLTKAAGDGNISIGGGDTRVTTVDMASAYATFASGGMYHAPHIVAEVTNPDKSVAYKPIDQEKQAFDANAKKNSKLARNVTEALLPVPGYSKVPCADGRLCAGKTGTHQLGSTGKNAKAWMVGYTPQISAAVSLSGENGAAISDASGGDIFGAKVPGKIWKTFMDNYHKAFKLPKEDFGKFDPIGDASGTVSQSSSRKSTDNSQNPTTTTDNKPTKPTKTTTTTTTTRTSRTRPTIPTIPGGNEGQPPAG